jgi:transcriptional regulator with XRE-family HTH domain
MQTVGGRIREWRRRGGLTLTELAKAAGSNKHRISNLERDERMLGDVILARIEQRLGLPTGDLVARSMIMRAPAPIVALLRGAAARLTDDSIVFEHRDQFTEAVVGQLRTIIGKESITGTPAVPWETDRLRHRLEHVAADLQGVVQSLCRQDGDGAGTASAPAPGDDRLHTGTQA